MRSALFRPGETLRRSESVRPLPKDAEISVAIGLENYPAVIRSPDRETIVPFERKRVHRFIPCHVVEPDRGWTFTLASVPRIWSKGNTLPIGRNPGRPVGADRNIETFYLSASIGKSQRRASVRISGSGNIRQAAVFRYAELHNTRDPAGGS